MTKQQEKPEFLHLRELRKFVAVAMATSFPREGRPTSAAMRNALVALSCTPEQASELLRRYWCGWPDENGKRS
jgi:hypothetical protein